MNDTSYCDQSIQFRVENRYLGEKTEGGIPAQNLRTTRTIPDFPGQSMKLQIVQIDV